GRLDKGLGRGSRPPEEVRFAIDSALEGDGFELSVPGRESVNIMESGLLSRKRGGSVGEPKVRIHLPPAEVCELLVPKAAEPLPRAGACEAPIPKGTEGSNPISSSGESANYRFRSRR